MGFYMIMKPIDACADATIACSLKVLANINIAEKRIPQDGKFRILSNGHEIDLRVSTFPALHGEKIVVRILDRADHTMALDKLGFDHHMAATFQRYYFKSEWIFFSFWANRIGQNHHAVCRLEQP